MTVVRLAIVFVLIVSGIVAFYGLVLDRSGQNIAFVVAGLAVFGLTLAFISAWFLVAALSAARWGHAAKAVGQGLAGGIFAIGAAGSLAVASIFAILTRLS